LKGSETKCPQIYCQLNIFSGKKIKAVVKFILPSESEIPALPGMNSWPDNLGIAIKIHRNELELSPLAKTRRTG